MGGLVPSTAHLSQFKAFFILQTLNETFKTDMSNKTSNSTSELLLNSALGKTLISILHRFMNTSIGYQTSTLLLKYLKSVASKGRLQPDQNFFHNYSVVLLKHFLLGLERSKQDQKKISAEIIFHLVTENPICLNFITKLIPKFIIRKLRGGLNQADLTKWKSQDWFNAIELLSEQLDTYDSDTDCVSVNVRAFLRDYIVKYYQSWEKAPEEVLLRVFENVIHRRASSLPDIVRVVQTRHNFEEFELNFGKLLDQVHVGKYVLSDLYDPATLRPDLLADISEPEVFYQELKNFYVNQRGIAAKVEALKVLTLLYKRYQLKKFELMPFFMNELSQTDDLVLQYHLIQFFCSLTDCTEVYTRFHNLNEFFKSRLDLYSRPRSPDGHQGAHQVSA